MTKEKDTLDWWVTYSDADEVEIESFTIQAKTASAAEQKARALYAKATKKNPLIEYYSVVIA